MNRIADRAFELVASVMRGGDYDRHLVAKLLGVSVAAADRYMRSAAAIPGVTLYKQGRQLRIAFSFSNALRKAGL